MTFEFDEAKSEKNLAKHGIDFRRARALWDDEQRVEIPARTDDEARSLVIGKVDGKLWSAVITHRGPSIRIISVRRSRREEVSLYEDQG